MFASKHNSLIANRIMAKRKTGAILDPQGLIRGPQIIFAVTPSASKETKTAWEQLCKTLLSNTTGPDTQLATFLKHVVDYLKCQDFRVSFEGSTSGFELIDETHNVIAQLRAYRYIENNRIRFQPYGEWGLFLFDALLPAMARQMKLLISDSTDCIEAYTLIDLDATALSASAASASCTSASAAASDEKDKGDKPKPKGEQELERAIKRRKMENLLERMERVIKEYIDKEKQKQLALPPINRTNKVKLPCLAQWSTNPDEWGTLIDFEGKIYWQFELVQLENALLLEQELRQRLQTQGFTVDEFSIRWHSDI